MGFYGNITNTSRTTFAFDKIYSSRFAMDTAAKTDGIYAGRYVLVNYENETSADSFTNTCYCYDDESGTPKMYQSLNICTDDSIFSGAIADISSATSSYPLSYASGAASTNGIVYTHLNYTGPVAGTEVTANTIKNNTVFKINIGNHISNASTTQQYIKIDNVASTSSVGFSYVTEDEYNEYWAAEPEVSHHAHIINSVLYLPDMTWEKVGAVFSVPAGYSYEANESVEIWAAVVEGDSLTWSNIAITDSDFLQNFEYDKAIYGVSRGYDSTVWQKLYSEGSEKYVMIAELNTVVPTFAISADAPTLVPISPHFDTDSTNVYYKFHWQPQWGFRVKSSNPGLTLHAINADGTENENAVVRARSAVLDTVKYPSDEQVEWKNNFYQSTTDTIETKYYNPTTGAWDSESSDNTKIDAAIYFNKDGFDVNTIAYSADLITEEEESTGTNKEYTKRFDSTIKNSEWTNEDRIRISPTGLSGNLYNDHNLKAGKSAKVDTQELELMLPTLGDTVAHLWDLAYGGRLTSYRNQQNNARNTDISWEDGKTVAQRRGLRLVTDENGEYYRPAQVETIAGCINTAHDILGMIISPIEQEISKDTIDYTENTDGSITLKNNSVLSAYDPDKIYFNKENKQYYRRHTTYNYNEITDYLYIPVYDVTTDTFVKDTYYYKDGSNYVEATEYVANTQYYVKSLKATTIYTPVVGNVDDGTVKTGFSTYEYGKYWYQDFSGNSAITDDTKKKLSDYIMYKEYLPNRDYYTVTAIQCKLAGKYSPNKYYQLLEDTYSLDTNEEPYLRDTGAYYTIDEENVTSITDLGFSNIYVPNVYYYYIQPSESEAVKDENGNYRYDAANNRMGGTYVRDASMSARPGIAYYKMSPFKDAKDKYIAVTQYTPVSNPTEEEFNSGAYWRDGNEGVKVPATGTFDSSTVYYLKETIYRLAEDEEDTLYQLDLTGDALILGTNLLNYIDKVFYSKVYNTDGDCLGYKKETRNSIVNTITKYYNGDESITEKDIEYYVFGYETVKSADYVSYSFLDPDNGNQPYNTALKQQETFYEQNKYHYKVDSGDFKDSYILDDNDTIAEERIYYKLDLIEPVRSDAIFYEPYEYYLPIGDGTDGQYAVATDLNADSSLTYYKKNGIYVLNDDARIYSKGAEWNIDANYIPASVTLATRVEAYDLMPLIGFARNLNTLHGMIVKINQTLESGDKLTRKSNSTAGILNQVNDIIAKFGKLCSNEFTIVDNYGRIRTAETLTLQKNTADQVKTKLTSTSTNYESTYRTGVSKDTYPIANTLGDMEKQWITTNIDGHATNPKITIHHNFQPVVDTATISDKNAAITDRTAPQNTAIDFDNNNTDNTLKLYTPIVDSMGHVVGKNTETVTLPFGFKILKTFNSTIDGKKWSQAAGVTSSSGELTPDIIADNTLDKLQIGAGNKWIRFTSKDGTDNILTIAHETHDFDTTAIDETNLNNDKDAKKESNLNIPEWSYDLAGHITAKKDHYYTLPFGFKTITTNGRGTSETDNTAIPTITDVIADTTQDTLAINSGNQWIKIDTDTANDKITISHDIHTPNVADTDATDLNTPATDTISLQDIAFDKAGHMTENRKHTYTLPYGFKTISTAGTSSTTEVTSMTSTNSVVADSTQDIFNIDPGNTWIKVTTDAGKDQIVISHEGADTTAANQTATTAGTDTVGTTTYKLEPQFGDSISIPEISYDKTGHVSKSSLHGVKIPQGSYTNTPEATNATGVITGIGFTPTTGAITSTSNFLGNIKLGEYTAPDSLTTIDAQSISASTINTDATTATAINTLDARIMAEEKARFDGILNTDRTFTVGTAGNYSTLIEAIDDITELIPSTKGNATIKILSGTIIKDQVILNGKDAGWITITSEDSEVSVEARADWQQFGYSRNTYPLFYGSNGAVLPTINTVFVLNKSSALNLPLVEVDDDEYARLVCGLCVHGSSKAIILPRCGFKDFNDNVISTNESSVLIHTGIASGAWRPNKFDAAGTDLLEFTTEHGWGIHARHNGEISARGCDLTYCAVAAYADRIADIDMREALVNGSNKIAQAEQLSRINANSIETINAAADSIESKSGSTINLNKNKFKGWTVGTVFIKVATGGTVDFNKCTDGYGGTMTLEHAKSYCNIVLNTTTPSGIIYCDAEDTVITVSTQEIASRINPAYDAITEEGIYLLKFTIDADNNKTPEWIKLEEWQRREY